MGLATIITMLIYVAVPLSHGFVYLAQVLFWIDVVLALFSCFGVPLFMYLVLFYPLTLGLWRTSILLIN